MNTISCTEVIFIDSSGFCLQAGAAGNIAQVMLRVYRVDLSVSTVTLTRNIVTYPADLGGRVPAMMLNDSVL